MLKTVQLAFEDVAIPGEVEEFVKDLDDRVEKFVAGKPFAQDGFVACDHFLIARALMAVQQQRLAAGRKLCEWGSGFGGVASIASLLGFESYGIEINREVLDHSIQLSRDYDLDVEFVEGSFIPNGADDLIDQAFVDTEGDLTLDCNMDDAYLDLGLEISDFDLVFVFPWPSEAPLLAGIFDRFAATGALLMIYNDFSGLRVQRKT